MEAGFRVIRRANKKREARFQALPKIRRSRRASLAQRLAAFVISVSAALPVATEPACPEPLVKGDKLVLVLSAGFDSLRARVRLFEKDKAAGWRSNGPAKPAVLGVNGLAGHRETGSTPRFTSAYAPLSRMHALIR